MSSPPPDPLIGTLVDDRYEVISRIARGGMATVYRARDSRLDRDVALKILHPHLAEGQEFVARFRREARAAAKLIHPGIVSVYDQGTVGESPYLVMELIAGQNLRSFLNSEGVPSLGRTLDIITQVLEALAVAHHAGFVHRDIKPENVLMTTSGKVKVADFGLARTVSEVTAASSGVVLGTVAYLSPELVSQGLADARSDVYAVGILLFEMLTGCQPFTGDAPIQVAFQHVHSTVPAPSTRVAWLPQEVDDLVAALTARDPAQRAANAGEATEVVRRARAAIPAALLERVPDVPRPSVRSGADPVEPVTGATSLVRAGHGPGAFGGTQAIPLGLSHPPIRPAPDPTPHSATPRRRRRRRWLVVSLVLVLLLAGGIGSAAAWYFMWGGPGTAVIVPTLVGRVQGDAEADLKALTLVPRVSQEFSDDVAAGIVLRAAPDKGASVDQRSVVELTVSAGIENFTIPDRLVGGTVDAVKTALTEANLDGEVTTEEQWDSSPAGQVLSITPTEGTTVPHNEPITILVSRGPQPIDLPNLLGLTPDEARDKLAELDIALTQTSTEYSDSVPAGQIMSQSHEPGPGLHRGDAISVTVSRGPEPVEIPQVIDREADWAENQLKELGFEVVREFPLGDPTLGRVLRVDPPVGNLVPPGTRVTISVV